MFRSLIKASNKKEINMSKTILFSPVGGTDPISENNVYDGSMLHICRYYKPDVVYLYMSEEISKKEETDHRYTRALKLLENKINHSFEVKIIYKDNLKDVHEFDFFYSEFSATVKTIISENSPEDKILLNISSGTPSMKSALIVLNSLGEFYGTCIQVSSPNRRMENHTHSENDYDLESLWELNEDNSENASDRTKIVSCTNLVRIRDKQRIESFIKRYDYESAYEMVQSLLPAEKEKFEPYIRFAKERYSLNLCTANSLNNTLKEKFFPITGADQQIFEYALACEIKRKKGELADFIRALTPLILDLFLKIASYHIEEFKGLTTVIGDDKVEVWNKDAILKSDHLPNVNVIKKVLEETYPDFLSTTELSRRDYLRSDHLCAILTEPCFNLVISEDIKLLRKNVEQGIRNMTAHQMVQIDDDKIKKITGVNSLEIMNLIKKLFGYTGKHIEAKSSLWNSYDAMNTVLIEKLNDCYSYS